VYRQEFQAGTTDGKDLLRQLHIRLTPNDLNEKFTKRDFGDNMFFVIIGAKGLPASDTPCRLDEAHTEAVTLDYGGLYHRALGYMRELSDRCAMPDGLMDFIMRYNALKISIETEHWLPAIGYYHMLKGGDGVAGASRGCGCKGCNG